MKQALARAIAGFIMSSLGLRPETESGYPVSDLIRAPEVLLREVRDTAIEGARDASSADEAMRQLEVSRQAEAQRRSLIVSNTARVFELTLQTMGLLEP